MLLMVRAYKTTTTLMDKTTQNTNLIFSEVMHPFFNPVGQTTENLSNLSRKKWLWQGWTKLQEPFSTAGFNTSLMFNTLLKNVSFIQRQPSILRDKIGQSHLNHQVCLVLCYICCIIADTWLISIKHFSVRKSWGSINRLKCKPHL